MEVGSRRWGTDADCLGEERFLGTAESMEKFEVVAPSPMTSSLLDFIAESFRYDHRTEDVALRSNAEFDVGLRISSTSELSPRPRRTAADASSPREGPGSPEASSG